MYRVPLATVSFSLVVGVMVEYQLSGAVEAGVGGVLAPLGGPKQRCVLAALLANHGTVVSVDRLIDAVWEDKPPPKALPTPLPEAGKTGVDQLSAGCDRN